MMSSRYILLALGLPALVRGTQYSLIKEYVGTNFFADWDFFGSYDNLTHGNVNWVNASQAASDQLAFVNSAGNAIMKVDNTKTLPPNTNRDSVRITTKDRYPIGSLWIVDMLHVPFGCSVWPAFWSFDSISNWPTGGEIDIFEGVNMMTNSQMALHTDPGCHLVNPLQTSTLINTTDCDSRTPENKNKGCVVKNPDQNSYGAAFAATGGGIFVTELAETGVSIWFFSRASIPALLQDGCTSVDTSTLGTPVANYPAGGCNINQFFQPQNLVFDITLCGDFAGDPLTFSETCSGVCTDLVAGPPSNFDNAFFEVRSVRAFSTPRAGAPRAVSDVSNGTNPGFIPGSSRKHMKRGIGMHRP